MRRLIEKRMDDSVLKYSVKDTIDSKRIMAEAGQLIEGESLNNAARMSAWYQPIEGDFILNKDGHTEYSMDVIVRRVKRKA